jgi:type IV pilus assembly protein PilE
MTASVSAKRQKGMTLMELLIVVTVVGILTSIAIPNYRNYMVRINRTDAKRDLLSIAQRLERCFTRSTDYQLAERGGGVACVALPQDTPEGTYTISGVVNATNFTLTATPINGQSDDAKCTTLTLNSAGVQGATGTLTPLQCWQGSGG